MRFGLCTISNEAAPATGVIARAGAAGYDAVEVWGKDHVGDGSPERCDRLRAAADAAGVGVAVYGSYLRAGDAPPPERVDHELAVADRLGADLIRVWAGDHDYEDRTEAAWSAAVEDLQSLTDRAADRGLGVTVERHAGTLTNAREGARRLIEAIDGPCGVNWQPPFGTDADGIVADARRLAPLTNNVHLQAVPSRDARDRCPLAEAYFDVPACVDALREGGFDGVLEVEFVADDVPYTEAIARDLDYLRSATGSPGAR